ncbi:MAG: hypothetical protein JWM85_3450 [Acidimicrobiaceae bacterium]|nr:hypothetical protein [Acidimicrobiaceae bacterium]
MHIVRVEHRDEPAPVVGVASGDRFYPLRSVARLSQLWAMRLQDLRPLVEAAVEGEDSMPSEDVHPLSPIDGRTELWAAGVTYEKSRLARVEESERAASVYELVYDAERPEVFFKAAAWRVSGDGDAISVREDSTVTVPEPEVAIVCNRFGEVVGLSTCNDVSSRSIEGANPL